MSTYPYWSLSFRMRPDVEPRTVRILESLARDAVPLPADLEALHPVLRYYLADWRRWLTGEDGPFVGPPIRLSSDHGGRILSIEVSQHDDEFANGGWIFVMWIECLVARSDRPGERTVIGCRGLYRNDYDTKLVVVTSAGVDEGWGHPVGFDVMEQTLADLDEAGWDSWRS